MTHFEYLQEVEEPALEEILKGEYEKVPICYIGMGQKRLIGKISE